MNDYDDIINLPHWQPQNHARMPLQNRAAQFAPFAALVGHDDAIRETARLTDAIIDLDSQSIDILNEKVALLLDKVKMHPEIEVTYFIRDAKKAGGAYSTYKGVVRAIDETERSIVFVDSTVISLLAVSDMRGEIFNEIDSRE